LATMSLSRRSWNLAWPMIASARGAGGLFSWGWRAMRFTTQPEAPLPAGGTRHPLRDGDSLQLSDPYGDRRADWAEGPRLYDWAPIGTGEGRGHHLQVGRALNPGEKGTFELAYLC
jgi:hypothetical protein